jgi:hypothetical protein
VERQADYVLLENKALAILAAQDAPDSLHETLVSSISVMPSFENYSAWTVFSNQAETEFIARRTCWDRHFDGSRFRDPFMGLKYGWGTTPTITSAVELLHYAGTVSLLSEAKVLAFSESITKAPIVLDGTRWKVFVSGAFGDQPQRWNWQPPEWKAMIEWTRRWVDFLDGHFEATQ